MLEDFSTFLQKHNFSKLVSVAKEKNITTAQFLGIKDEADIELLFGVEETTLLSRLKKRKMINWLLFLVRK